MPMSRRDLLKTGAAASFASLAGWRGELPAVLQGEEVVPWTDIPANFDPKGALDSRTLHRLRRAT